ncbi:hypothetical protein amb3770 [Paramagnetospirillum magneticum AMB-1]|uniref:Uncharacterized protein n=1 Tax=Paramagnetospirillum magneticum (strain ATCC 700264 / AMB-1) TaxID=342108 RepID=Q2W0Q1_PARM1|nr:hypothetical protein amb3770 [Paramagnetospirillum magneticum AMB-1]
MNFARDARAFIIDEHTACMFSYLAADSRSISFPTPSRSVTNRVQLPRSISVVATAAYLDEMDDSRCDNRISTNNDGGRCRALAQDM